MPANILSTIIKLAILSLIVGLLLAFFGIEPLDIFNKFGETAVAIFNKSVSFLEWAVKYIIIGAMVVLPIWLILFLFRLGSKK